MSSQDEFGGEVAPGENNLELTEHWATGTITAKPVAAEVIV